MEFKHDANMKASLGHTRTRDVTPLLILLLTDIDYTLKTGQNASLLVLKDLQPSNSEKTNWPSLGILQKEIMGYLFPQRTGA